VKDNSASSFNFSSYAIEKFNLSFGEEASGLLISEYAIAHTEMEWIFSIKIANPKYIKSESVYICGVACKVTLKKTEKTEQKGQDKTPTPLLIIDAIISGVFGTDGQLPRETEERIAKAQAPAILLPYLRGTITTFLSNAGYGSVTFPLININKVAETDLKDTPIEVIE